MRKSKNIVIARNPPQADDEAIPKNEIASPPSADRNDSDMGTS